MKKKFVAEFTTKTLHTTMSEDGVVNVMRRQQKGHHFVAMIKKRSPVF